MNKLKITMGIAAVGTAAITLAACSSGNKFSGTSTKNIDITAKEYNAFYKHTAEVYKTKINLGDYKNLTVKAVDRSNENIIDEAVTKQLETIKNSFAKKEDVTNGGTTQSGDEIVLNYTGYINGEKFENGSATDQSYTVGSLKFISDLDKGLVGKQANQEYEIPVKFPENYSASNLAGKDAVFKVTITKITRTTTPELTDALVKENAAKLELEGYGSNLKTVDELKNGVKTALHDAAKLNNDTTILTEAITKLEESGYTVSEYPEEELQAYVSNMKANMESQYNTYGSASGYSSFKDYLKGTLGIADDAAFDEYCKTSVQSYMKEKMAISVIGAENNINVSVADLTKFGNQYASYYGYNSYQELVEKYGLKLNAEVGYNTLRAKVAEFMASHVKEEPADSSNTETSPTTTQETTTTTDK